MEQSEVNPKFTRVLFLIFVLIPLLGLIVLASGSDFSFDPSILWKPLTHSLLFAMLSSLFSVFFGFLGAMALVSLPNWEWLRLIVLAPTLLPSLFVLVALIAAWSPFPFGWIGSVFGIVMTSCGLVSVGLSHLMRERLVGISEAALVMGVSRISFVFKILLPLMTRDILSFGTLVFGFAFSSFAIPLVLGAGQVQTIEFAIYQLAFRDSQYTAALAVGFIQVVALFFLNWSLQGNQKISSTSYARIEYLKSWILILLVLMPSFILVFGLFRCLSSEFFEIATLLEQKIVFLKALAGTIMLSLSVGLSVVLFLRYSLKVLNSAWIERFLLSFHSPSTVFLSLGWWGIVGIPLSRMSVPLSWVILTCVLLSAYFCTLLRMSWSGRMAQLKGQVEIAQVMGASSGQIEKQILWPQMKPLAWRLGGLAGFWASGDFTFSTLLSGQDWTLALVAESYLGFYKIETAMLLTCSIVMWGGLLYWIFGRLADVDN